MPESPDACLPTAVTDFIFDLYDSVSISQLVEEQTKLYRSTLPDLSQKYFATTPWPSATSIASECNGDPLFLAVYRELTHRHWHSMSHPNLSDRMEGWDVYRELFDEILEADFFLLPVWVFEILHEFVYQFQGFCQIRTVVYAAARKHGLLDASGQHITTGVEVSSKNLNLQENLILLQNNKDAWDTEAVFGYLHRLIQLGMPSSTKPANVQPVYTYFALFGSIALSRLECLLGDYTASLQALDTVHSYADEIIPKDENHSVAEVLGTVFAARLSLAYHAGVSYLMLRRYKNAAAILAECAGNLQRGFKTGVLRSQAGFDQFNKQYDRILNLLAILQQICPSMPTTEDSVMRVVREKYGSKIEIASSFEEWFQSPKFIAADPLVGTMHRQQVDIFNAEMKATPAGKNLRSYLKLYTSLPVAKLANFHDLSVDEFLPLLLAFKLHMRQMERGEGDTYTGGSLKTALDIHYYVENDMVHVDEAEMQRRFETYFLAQITQNIEIRQEVLAIKPEAV